MRKILLLFSLLITSCGANSPSIKSNFEGQSSCFGSCDQGLKTCNHQAQNLLENCIAEHMDTCLIDCRRRGIVMEQCQKDFCSWIDPSNITRAFYRDKCESKVEFREQLAMCAAKERNCQVKCQP